MYMLHTATRCNTLQQGLTLKDSYAEKGRLVRVAGLTSGVMYNGLLGRVVSVADNGRVQVYIYIRTLSIYMAMAVYIYK